jgi:hypothetical protein
MYTITEKQYNDKPNDYKSIYSSDFQHGTKLNGKRTLLTWLKREGTCLLIEGQSFEIVKTEKENVNPLFN